MSRSCGRLVQPRPGRTTEMRTTEAQLTFQVRAMPASPFPNQLTENMHQHVCHTIANHTFKPPNIMFLGEASTSGGRTKEPRADTIQEAGP